MLTAASLTRPTHPAQARPLTSRASSRRSSCAPVRAAPEHAGLQPELNRPEHRPDGSRADVRQPLDSDSHPARRHARSRDSHPMLRPRREVPQRGEPAGTRVVERAHVARTFRPWTYGRRNARGAELSAARHLRRHVDVLAEVDPRDAVLEPARAARPPRHRGRGTPRARGRTGGSARAPPTRAAACSPRAACTARRARHARTRRARSRGTRPTRAGVAPAPRRAGRSATRTPRSSRTAAGPGEPSGRQPTRAARRRGRCR